MTDEHNAMTLCVRITQLVDKHGSLRAAAKVTGVNPQYLCRLKNGEKLNPSDDTLRRLGLKRHVYYTRIGK